MPTPENVEKDLGWSLFATVRRYRQLTDDLLADLPGGPRGYQVLMTAQQGGPKNQLALAKYLGVDRTVMTYLIDDLEGAGLVERKPDPADRRARRVELTRAGTAALARARRRLRTAEADLLAPLAPEDGDTLRGLLHQLATNSQPAADDGGAEADRHAESAVPRRRTDRRKG